MIENEILHKFEKFSVLRNFKTISHKVEDNTIVGINHQQELEFDCVLHSESVSSSSNMKLELSSIRNWTFTNCFIRTNINGYLAGEHHSKFVTEGVTIFYHNQSIHSDTLEIDLEKFVEKLYLIGVLE